MVVEVYNLPLQTLKLVEMVDLVVAVVVMILVDHLQVALQTQPRKEMMAALENLPEQMLVEVVEHLVLVEMRIPLVQMLVQVVAEFNFHQHSKTLILLVVLVLLVHLELIGLLAEAAEAETQLLVVVEVVPFLHHMPEQVKVVQEIQQQHQHQHLQIQDLVVVELEDMKQVLQEVLVVQVLSSSYIPLNK
tara:strand:- start:38 stop:607 length:570 start_codon:yes stop_codon:yes gene_type:complete